MAHKVYTSLSSLLFLSKIFLEPYFFNATVGFFDKRVNVPLILCALAG
jgi:hypothetical protein